MLRSTPNCFCSSLCSSLLGICGVAWQRDSSHCRTLGSTLAGCHVGHLAARLRLACGPLVANDSRWTDSPGCPQPPLRLARAEQLASTRLSAVWRLVVALAP